MAVGIFNKLKKSFKALGSRINGFAKRTLTKLPEIVDTGKKILGAVSPILTNVMPGSGLVLNGLNRGLDYIGKFGETFSGNKYNANKGIGKSLISELD